MPNVSFQAPTDYGADLQAIERRRQYADALRQQSMQPLETQMAGGWAIPISPTQGLAKALQAFASQRMQKKADEDTKGVSARYNSDLVRVLTEGGKLSAGTPARFQQPDPQEFEQAADQGTQAPSGFNVAAKPGDPMAAAALYMTHPATQQLGMQEMQRQRMMEAFGLNGGSAPQGGASSGATSPGAPTSSGVPRNIALQLMLADPTGKLLAQENAKANAEATKPINVRPGGAVFQQGKGVLFNQPQVGPGVMLNYGPNGPTASAVPGASDAMAAQAAAVAGGTQAGKAPYELSTVNTPGAPTLMTHQQQIEAATGRPMPRPGMIPTSAVVGQNPEMAGRPQAEQDAIRKVMDADTRGQPATVNVPAPGGLRLQDQGDSAQQKAYGTERGQLLAARPQATLSARTAITNMERLSNVARELENHPGLSGITGKVNQYAIGDLLPETRAARALQDTMVKQAAVQTLQAMREASKTGGAVGAVTEGEWPILERQLAALDAAQGTKDYRVALKNLQNQMAGAITRTRAAYKETYGEDLKFESTSHQTQGRSVREQADEILNGKH